MAERFSFDGALLHGFRAAHARTFPWSFALAFALIIGIFLFARAPLWGFVGAILLYLLTASIEALNTAVEELTDHASPGYSKMAEHAKDLGSFAVFCLLLANGIWAAFVLASHWGWLAA